LPALAVLYVLPACSGEPTAAVAGQIVVHVVTAGSAIDGNGYTLIVDDDSSRTVGPTDSLTLRGVAPGEHHLRLTGLAANCQASASPVNVVVKSGTTVDVRFRVECVPPVGTIVVTTFTAGSDVDSDGYILAFSGTNNRMIGVRDSVVFADVPLGAPRSVSLMALAPNCTVTGPSERSVEPVFQSVLRVAFHVMCTAYHTLSFSRDDPAGTGVYTIRSDGQLRQRLGDGSFDFSDATWSRDGSRIAVAGEGGQIYVLDPDGNNPRRITSDGGAFPAWSPDGTRIVFIGPGSGCCDIYAVNADGSALTRLTNGGGGGYGRPSFAPDGSRIIFHNCSASDGCTIQTMNPDGSDVRTLTEQSDNYNPSYNRDGSRILFFSYRSGQGRIYEMTADGSNVRLLSFLGFTDWAVYSPDDSRIAFHKTTNDGRHIFIVNADGTGQIRLTSDTTFNFRPRWKP